VTGKVMMVDHYSGIGGAELSLAGLLEATPEGLGYWSAAFPTEGPIVDRLRAGGFEVHVVPAEGWRWWIDGDVPRWKFYASLPLQAWSLLRWVSFFRRTSPRLVHFNINRLVEPVLAAWLLRIPSVMHFRDIPSRIEARFAVGWRGFYWLMRRASAWIANSSATARDVEPYSKEPVRLVHNGVDLVAFDRAAMEGTGPAPDGPETAAMVALLVPWKNHGLLLDVASVLKRRGRRFRILVAGKGNGDWDAHLREAARERGVDDVVQFLGHVSNVPALLRGISVLVHTTSEEPFGRVFLEAMAAGLPVVAARSGGALDVVEDGVTGILVPPGDAEAFADALARLFDDPALRQRLGNAGRRRAEERFSLERHVKAVLEIHREVLAGA
jgi:glycosyltransferase involved in cell wall biosynthesis